VFEGIFFTGFVQIHVVACLIDRFGTPKLGFDRSGGVLIAIYDIES
jgi:hypothetical protein